MKTIYVIAILLAMLGIAGAVDYEAELQEEQHYCDMVKSGNWPAYKEGVNCGKE